MQTDTSRMNKPNRYSFLSSLYSKHSFNRKTSNEEFNRDAKHMAGIKEMYLKIHERLRERPSERRKKFADMVHSYCKDESIRIKNKTWPNEQYPN